MANDGYGTNFEAWDRAVAARFKDQLARLGSNHRYGVPEIFRSPKGRWMAFHNPKYSDVRVVDLETGEIVATDVYSNRDPEVYDGFHANFTMYVPSYFRTVLNLRNGDEPNLMHVSELDDKDFESVDWDALVSIPLAFYSYTFWAADYEFYVELLDLREIDDGKIHVLKDVGFTMARSASHVRQYVLADAESYIDLGPPVIENGMKVYKPTGTNSAQRNEFGTGFRFLEERRGPHLFFGVNGNERFSLTVDGKGDKAIPVEREPELPWMKVQRRQENKSE